MVEVGYLSIAEFAEKAKVSKQAIYKQVNNENSQIAPFVLREGKRTLIKVSALSELYGVDTTEATFTTPTEDKQSTFTTPKEVGEVEEATQGTTADNPQEQPAAAVSTAEVQPLSTDYIEFLKAQIAELKAEKADVEQRLNATIQEKDGIIKDQSAQLAQLAQQVAQIADKALIATSQQQYLTAMEKGDKADTGTIEAIPVEEQTPEKPKKGFLRRFFG